jgi:hypothetical protein
MDDSAALKAAKELAGMVGDEPAAKLIQQVIDDKRKSIGTSNKDLLPTPSGGAVSKGSATTTTTGAADTPSRGPWWPI